MDYQSYLSSASTSPSTATFSNIYFDGSSDSSAAESPYGQTSIDTSLVYSMHNYDAPMPIAYFTSQSLDSTNIESNSNSSHDRSKRRKRSDSPKSVDLEATSTMHLRRRAQNRASQRAFRERKEKHVKGLEYQLEELHEKHQDLLQSYSKQTEEMAKLQSRIRQLANELNTAKETQEHPSWNEFLVQPNFDTFDAFSTTDLLYSPGGPSGHKMDSTHAATMLHDLDESL